MKKNIWIVLIASILTLFVVYICFFHQKEESCNLIHSYQLIDSEIEIPIPKNSCFISECCEYVASFQTKMKEQELQKELDDLQQKWQEIAEDYTFTYHISEQKTYRGYSIYYQKKE